MAKKKYNGDKEYKKWKDKQYMKSDEYHISQIEKHLSEAKKELDARNRLYKI